MSDNQNVIKKRCGMWGATVIVSSDNDNGKCRCIDCQGVFCKMCTTYQSRREKIMDGVDFHAICMRCMQREK